jgi:hypothetical protein
MSLGMTRTTLQQTVNLIRGLRGMAAVAMFAFGHGLGSLLPGVAQFSRDLFIQGRDLPKQRSGKVSLTRLTLT